MGGELRRLKEERLRLVAAIGIAADAPAGDPVHLVGQHAFQWQVQGHWFVHPGGIAALIGRQAVQGLQAPGIEAVDGLGADNELGVSGLIHYPPSLFIIQLSGEY
ncbi:hypothetical protein FQZ97_971330 [compost metagenome]